MELPVLRIFNGFYTKYKPILMYLFFGGLTTFISIAVFAAFYEGMKLNESVANVISWVCAVLFAYVTNRKYVFMSTNPKIFKEFVSFTSSRVITLFADMLIMWLLPPVLYGWKVPYADWVATFISAVVVTVLNYIFSKLMVFRKKKTA